MVRTKRKIVAEKQQEKNRKFVDSSCFSEEGGGKRMKKASWTVKSSSPLKENGNIVDSQADLHLPAIHGSRSVEEFHCLEKIEEGAFGVVYRAKDKRTDEIVALKHLKIREENNGFAVASLREIKLLQKIQHPNIVAVKEIVVGTNTDNIYIVMEFVEHDIKSVMKNMKQPFSIGEVKTLMIQLLSAVAHLHSNWILHRDLKLSNILLNQNGVLKVADFGLAREYGDPLQPYTPVVVTLWYRAPELLLGVGEKLYSTPVDMWSVGCIFGELIAMKPLFPGESETNQLEKIFQKLGLPDKENCNFKLPPFKKAKFSGDPSSNLRNHLNLTDSGLDLMLKFLTYDPSSRITADDALTHDFFDQQPIPVSVNSLGMWLSKGAQNFMCPSYAKQRGRQMKEAKAEFKAPSDFILRF